ncbi:MAG: hypothetical protein QM770_22095 [Tepidisphaeraceae bacterium]
MTSGPLTFGSGDSITSTRADAGAGVVDLIDDGVIQQRLARPNHAVERRPRDLGQHHLVGEVLGFTDQHAGRLRNALDDQALRHDRPIRVEVVDVVFRQ